MTDELSLSLAQSINAAHHECQTADEPIRNAILVKCNRVRQCGILLQEAKASIGHGNFGNWIAEKLTFSPETAQLYMRYARANPQPITELADGIAHLRDALVVSGALSCSGHNSQNRSSLTILDHLTTHAMKLMGLINGIIEKSGGPVEEWSDEQKEVTRKQLEPIVQIYNRLLTAP